MARASSYLISVAVIIAGSILVVADDTPNPCFQVNVSLHPNLDDCKTCVATKINATNSCIYLIASGAQCVNATESGEQVNAEIKTVDECVSHKLAPTTPTTSTTTPTTTSPHTDTTTTPPTTQTTTVTTAKTTETTTSSPPTTKSTTTPTPATTTTSTGTSTTTTPGTGPTSNTTAVPSTTAAPTAAPKSSGMSVGSFFAGIIFTLCMSGLGYLVFRFYKARMDRNYHTFSNPSF